MISFNKKGLTLVELMISVSIFTVGIAGFTLLFIRSWQTNSFVIETGEASLVVSRGMDNTIRELRKVRQSDIGGYAIKSVGNFDLTVYLDNDDDGITEQVHYFLDLNLGEFKKGVSKPSGSPLSYPDSDQTVSTIARYIVNTNAQPVFYYYNKDYPADMEHNPLTVPVVNSDVRLIEIHLWVNIKPVSAPDNINIQSFVELRNLNEN